MDNKEAIKYLKEALSEKKFHLEDLEAEAIVIKQDINVITHLIDQLKPVEKSKSKAAKKEIPKAVAKVAFKIPKA